MQSSIRGALIAVAGLSAAGIHAQTQTNINVYDKNKTEAAAPRDTVYKVDTVLTREYGLGGTTDTIVTRENTETGTITTKEAVIETEGKYADTVGNIEASDVKKLERRKQAKHFLGAGFGPGNFGGMDDPRQAYDAYLGQFWEVNSRAAIKATGEIATDLTERHIFDLNLGANLYAVPYDFSPYIGGGMGFGWGMQDNDRAFGMNVGGSIGALLFRTSNTQMNIEGNAKLLLSELDGDDAVDSEFPSVYSMRLGVLF